jgi:hypothetical protein
MNVEESRAEMQEIALEAYGVRTIVSTNSAQLLRQVENVLPPGWMPCPDSDIDQRFVVTTDDGFFYDIAIDGELITMAAELDIALGVLDAQLRAYIARHAPGRIFVHAGVVAYADRAIVIPGASLSGKTTLVAELVRAGAIYYSDEFAVLDDDGLIYPYAKPLSIRSADFSQTDHHVAAFGGTAGVEPIRAGLVVVAHYSPGAEWQPRRLSPGEAVLALLANTVPAQDRPAQSLAAIKNAVEGAIVLEGDRGEASAAVNQLLDGQHAAAPPG